MSPLELFSEDLDFGILVTSDSLAFFAVGKRKFIWRCDNAHISFQHEVLFTFFTFDLGAYTKSEIRELMFVLI